MRKYYVILCSGLAIVAGFGFADEMHDVIYSPEAKVSEVFRRPDVQKELEIVDDQAQTFERIRSEYSKKVDESVRESEELPTRDIAVLMQRTSKILQLIQKQHQDQMAARQEVLLPFQLRRLDEIVWQYRSHEDPVGAFDLALDLSDEQRERLRERETELRSELRTQLESFKHRAEREILELLTPDQRRELYQKTGQEFHFESSERGLSSLKRLH